MNKRLGLVANHVARERKPRRHFSLKTEGLLSGKPDRFAGITIDEQSIKSHREDFAKQLSMSLATWASEGARGIWLKLSTENSHLVDIAVKEHKFEFHHAKPGYIMLTRWLPEGSSHLPGYASHYVGVGGLVFNKDRTKILSIQEKTPMIKGLWKLPGGLVDSGETVQQAAEREVWEETGVKTKFKSVLSFREVMDFKFGQADLYVICLLEALDENINIQFPHEIAACEWKPLVRNLALTRL